MGSRTRAMVNSSLEACLSRIRRYREDWNVRHLLELLFRHEAIRSLGALKLDAGKGEAEGTLAFEGGAASCVQASISMAPISASV